MANSILRWALFFAALLAVGPLAFWIIQGTLAADGSHHATPLVSSAPVIGLLRAVVCIILALATGALSARLVSLNLGLLNTGVVLAWAAGGTGTVDQVLRSTQSASVAYRLAIEGGVLGFVLAGGACMITLGNNKRIAALGPVPEGTPADRPYSRADHAVVFACVVAAGFIAAWVVAQNMLKGQAIAAGAVAGILGAASSLMIVKRAHPAVLVTGLMALAVIGPILGLVIHGSAPASGMVAKATAGTLINIARLTPLDWFAGGFIGLPLGRSLAGWLGEVQVRPEPSPAS